MRVEEDKALVRVGWSSQEKWNGGEVGLCGCREIDGGIAVLAVEDGGEPRRLLPVLNQRRCLGST